MSFAFGWGVVEIRGGTLGEVLTLDLEKLARDNKEQEGDSNAQADVDIFQNGLSTFYISHHPHCIILKPILLTLSNNHQIPSKILIKSSKKVLAYQLLSQKILIITAQNLVIQNLTKPYKKNVYTVSLPVQCCYFVRYIQCECTSYICWMFEGFLQARLLEDMRMVKWRIDIGKGKVQKVEVVGNGVIVVCVQEKDEIKTIVMILEQLQIKKVALFSPTVPKYMRSLQTPNFPLLLVLPPNKVILFTISQTRFNYCIIFLNEQILQMSISRYYDNQNNEYKEKMAVLGNENGELRLKVYEIGDGVGRIVGSIEEGLIVRLRFLKEECSRRKKILSRGDQLFLQIDDVHTYFFCPNFFALTVQFNNLLQYSPQKTNLIESSSLMYLLQKNQSPNIGRWKLKTWLSNLDQTHLTIMINELLNHKQVYKNLKISVHNLLQQKSGTIKKDQYLGFLKAIVKQIQQIYDLIFLMKVSIEGREQLKIEGKFNEVKYLDRSIGEQEYENLHCLFMILPKIKRILEIARIVLKEKKNGKFQYAEVFSGVGVITIVDLMFCEGKAVQFLFLKCFSQRQFKQQSKSAKVLKQILVDSQNIYHPLIHLHLKNLLKYHQSQCWLNYFRSQKNELYSQINNIPFLLNELSNNPEKDPYELLRWTNNTLSDNLILKIDKLSWRINIEELIDEDIFQVKKEDSWKRLGVSFLRDNQLENFLQFDDSIIFDIELRNILLIFESMLEKLLSSENQQLNQLFSRPKKQEKKISEYTSFIKKDIQKKSQSSLIVNNLILKLYRICQKYNISNILPPITNLKDHHNQQQNPQKQLFSNIDVSTINENYQNQSFSIREDEFLLLQESLESNGEQTKNYQISRFLRIIIQFLRRVFEIVGEFCDFQENQEVRFCLLFLVDISCECIDKILTVQKSKKEEEILERDIEDMIQKLLVMKLTKNQKKLIERQYPSWRSKLYLKNEQFNCLLKLKLKMMIFSYVIKELSWLNELTIDNAFEHLQSSVLQIKNKKNMDKKLKDVLEAFFAVYK